MLSEGERSRIKHFLGFPDLSQEAQSILLGIPAGAEPLFLVEGAMNRLTQGGEESVRASLCQCEATEQQIGTSRQRMQATKLGSLETNQNESTALRRELEWWSRRLADDLGVPPNMFSQQYGAGGGINARVVSDG